MTERFDPEDAKRSLRLADLLHAADAVIGEFDDCELTESQDASLAMLRGAAERAHELWPRHNP